MLEHRDLKQTLFYHVGEGFIGENPGRQSDRLQDAKVIANKNDRTIDRLYVLKPPHVELYTY